jgi:hypothetical protein
LKFPDNIASIKEELSGGGPSFQAPPMKQVPGARDGERLYESTKQFKECIRCKVSVKRMDPVGSEYGGDSYKEKESMEALETHLAYLKLINVPSMFDIGGLKADPT